jgi:hypothetical protein
MRGCNDSPKGALAQFFPKRELGYAREEPFLASFSIHLFMNK